MTRPLAGLLAAALALAGTGPAEAASGVAPASAPPPSVPADTVVAPPGGPTLVLHSRSASPVTALRVRAPLQEGDDEVAAVELLRRAGLSRARGEAERLGIRVDAARTATGLAYTAVGSASELDHLVGVLRRALARPEPHEIQSAAQALLDWVEETRETPDGLLRERLRSRALGRPSPEEIRTALQDLRFGTVEEVWARSHLRTNLEVVAVGPHSPGTALASVRELGEGEEPAPAGGTVPALRPDAPDEPQILRHWHGVAYAGESGDLRWSLAAALISRRARQADAPYELGVELVEAEDRMALLVMGAAYPGDQDQLEARLEGLAEELATSVSAPEVAEAREGLKGEWAAAVGTPWGMAEFLDVQRESGESTRSVAAALGELAELDEGDMRAFFQRLAESDTYWEVVLP